MAPMEPAQAEDSMNREVLEQALEGSGLEELQEMGRRLARSREQFTETLDDLKAEQTALKEENEYYQKAIDDFMTKMREIKISSSNTVEPMLDEGPLDFVGRMWEKVKPRNNGVIISEHVGEIRKPEDQEKSPHAIQEQSKQVVQKLSASLGPIWQRAETLVKDARGEIAKQVAERQKQRSQREVKGPGPSRRAEKLVGSNDADELVPEAASSVSASSGPAPAPEGPAEPAEAEPAPPPLAPAGEEAAPDAAQDQNTSTILIEAQLKLDDGSTHTLHVRAADRCKEVAQRFVQEHSLKAWFQAPLTAWLKKVEADAETFPVKVEGDLMEIRKLHAKAK